MFAVCSKNFTPEGNITQFNKHWILGMIKGFISVLELSHTCNCRYSGGEEKSTVSDALIYIQKTKVGVGAMPEKRPHFNVLYEF